ncbi:conserved hypothetical protein [Magnetococcus marinus MC-1]|uniref:Uncharacterized protein n=1 Tax=Magnetococcus marinus (strain ATCC BAA-1437 / JCM 17883 / MC-1) TaxID=156889 RepID=A0LBP8_MAGMM|nr:hypothetical protein [Magnetococcus marinus]ABK45391.1 conserved hypothetical protein [Magnetococcus marinus MC-1]
MLLSQSEWARQQGFSRQYVSKLVKKGVVRLVDGKVDPVQASQGLESVREPARPVQRKVMESRGPVSAVSSADEGADLLPQGGHAGLPTMLLKARIRSELKRGSLLEIKEKIEAGKYVEADEVKIAAFNRARLVRDQLLKLPDRLAAELAAEANASVVHGTLVKEIRAALEGIDE